MDVRLASQPAPGRTVNEDGALAVGNLVAVFDGVTQLPDLDSGCFHGPAWYVRHLMAQLANAYAVAPDAPLSQLLARAIEGAADKHRDTCDLTHPASPAATACMLRAHDDRIDYLVLCDSPLVLELGHRVEVINDCRFDQVIGAIRNAALVSGAIGTGRHAERVKAATLSKLQYLNQPAGYWIASTDPRAAYEAVTGSAPLYGRQRVRRAALLTDGASAAVEQFALFEWDGLLDVLTESGPGELIRRVRAAEHADHDGSTRPRYKQHDDATAAICQFEGIR